MKIYKQISLSSCAIRAIDILEKAGYEAWIVGGYIRDSILQNDNINNKDIDIATNAHPNQVKKVFENKNWAIYNLGFKFGTIGVIDENYTCRKIIEITTYRQESDYINGRHPNTISFKNDITQDLSRRDFTINAIAYNPEKGILDPYNGINDINNKIIKTVGEPKDRFLEDYLRMLRALRFASQLGFNIDNETKKSIFDHKVNINKISIERIRDELNKLLIGKYAKEVLETYKEVIFEIIPELKPLDGFDQKTKYHSFDIYTHTLVTLEKMDYKAFNNEDSDTKIKAQTIGQWSALLHDIGKPECFTLDTQGQGHFYGHPIKSENISRSILNKLKFSKKMINSIMLLVRWHDQPMSPTVKSVGKMLRKFVEKKCELYTNDIFKIYCSLRKADSYAHAENFRENFNKAEEIEKVFNIIVQNQEVFKLSDLKINGNDILKMGVKPGPKISYILNECLNKVTEKEINNEKNSLLKYAKFLISNEKK